MSAALSTCFRRFTIRSESPGKLLMIIVTGGAGMIGSNIVAALNSEGRPDIVVVDDLTDGRKFREPRRPRNCGLSRQGRVPAAAGGRRAGRHRGGLPPGRLLDDDRMERQAHDGRELRLFQTAARGLPGAQNTLSLRLLGFRLRGRLRFSRRARMRAPAQRLRLFQEALRRPCPPRRARQELLAGGGPSLFQRLWARARPTRGRWPPWRSISSTRSGEAKIQNCSAPITGSAPASRAATSSMSGTSPTSISGSGGRAGAAYSTAAPDVPSPSARSRRR